ncbi:MAG: hypothetical protein WBM34_05740 [Woeseiaceae bacterium]
MLKASSTILLLISLLLSINALADETTGLDADSRLSTVVALYLEALRSETEYTSPSRLSQPVETLAYSGSESSPIANLDFQNSATIARVSRLRELSLLTLAEVKGTRLFLGVNRKGLVGLHFRARGGVSAERCLEVARMPYLAKATPGNRNP